jgi:mono/diheme cytochrome c family protein
MRFGVVATGFMSMVLAGCQGQTSEEPPIHLNLNMDFQTNFKAQEENKFFADGRSQRPQVPGTVARGQLHENEEFSFGKVGADYAKKIPASIDKTFVERGQERFNIYCVPCQGRTGSGDGIVVKRGMLKPPSFHDQRIIDMPDGEIYGAILNGVRGNMPSYAYAIPVQDRWAIVSYLRALQLSQRATLQDVPGDISNSKGWTK